MNSSEISVLVLFAIVAAIVYKWARKENGRPFNKGDWAVFRGFLMIIGIPVGMALAIIAVFEGTKWVVDLIL